jgi:hypothetical protein
VCRVIIDGEFTAANKKRKTHLFHVTPDRGRTWLSSLVNESKNVREEGQVKSDNVMNFKSGAAGPECSAASLGNFTFEVAIVVEL